MDNTSKGLWGTLQENYNPKIKYELSFDELKEALIKQKPNSVEGISVILINNLSDEEFIEFHKKKEHILLQGGLEQVQFYNERKLKLIKNE